MLPAYPQVDISEFYNDALNEDYFSSQEEMMHELKLWRKDLSLSNKFCATEHFQSFISFPFPLTPATKASILEKDALIQMRDGYRRDMQIAILSGQRSFMPYLVLPVRRDHIVEDTIMYLSLQYEGPDFKKPLKVIFDGEDGVDAGGVRKEFFQVLIRKLLDPSYGMYKYFEDSRLLYFNADSNILDTAQDFELIGILLGMAIYNSIILDLKMPSFIYKKLKGCPLGIEDLEELNPGLARGLKALLSFDGRGMRETFETTFQISFERFGEVVTVDLKENGGEIFVDETNRQEYVDLYVDYVLNRSVQSQFESFNRGFQKVPIFSLLLSLLYLYLFLSFLFTHTLFIP